MFAALEEIFEEHDIPQNPIAEIGEHGSNAPEILGPKNRDFLEGNFTHFLFVVK